MGIGHHAREKTALQHVGSIVNGGFEQDRAGTRFAQYAVQQGSLMRRHGKAEFANGRAVAAVLRAQANVAAAGNFKPGTHAIAIHGGNERAIQRKQGRQRAPRGFFVKSAQALRIKTKGWELGNIRASAKIAI